MLPESHQITSTAAAASPAVTWKAISGASAPTIHGKPIADEYRIRVKNSGLRRTRLIFSSMVLNPYATNLHGQDPIPVLITTAERLRVRTAPLSGSQINNPSAPGKWSICNIVAHLADCEIVFAFRLRQTLAPEPDQPHAIIQPFDQDRWGKRYEAYHLEPALVFQAVRNWNLLSRRTTATALPPHPERHHDPLNHRRNHGRPRYQPPEQVGTTHLAPA